MKPWILAGFTLLTACQPSQPATEQPTAEASAAAASDAPKNDNLGKDGVALVAPAAEAPPNENLPLGFAFEPHAFLQTLSFQMKEADHFGKDGTRITNVEAFLREPRFWSVQTFYNDDRPLTVNLENRGLSFGSQGAKPVTNLDCQQKILLANPLVVVNLYRDNSTPTFVSCKPAL
jgi:hypothetical protein